MPMGKITQILGFSFVFLSLSLAVHAQSPSVIEVGMFSRATVGNGFPEGWKALNFKKIERHTNYTLVKDEDTVVVKAIAEASASGLIREMKINPKESPWCNGAGR